MWLKVTVFSEKVSPFLASQNFTRVFCLSGNDGKRPDHKIQQIPANLRIHDCRSNIMFNRPFYSSLRSRRLEVVGARKNERARGRHARGEGAPAQKAHAWIVSRPQSSWQPLRDLSEILTENEWLRTDKACRQKAWYILLFKKDSQSFILSARHQPDTWTNAPQETRGMAWFCGCWEF